MVAALTGIIQKDADDEVQREAVEALGKVRGHAGVGALIDIARTHPNPDVRRKAVKTVGEIAPPDAALGLLEELARRDPDDHVQQEAVEALGHMDDPRALAPLHAWRAPSRARRYERKRWSSTPGVHHPSPPSSSSWIESRTTRRPPSSWRQWSAWRSCRRGSGSQRCRRRPAFTRATGCGPRLCAAWRRPARAFAPVRSAGAGRVDRR